MHLILEETALDLLTQYALIASRYIIVLLSLAIIVRCIRSMLSGAYEDEYWGFITFGDEEIPILHWENIIGRSHTSDIFLDARNLSRTHAALVRNGKGVWKIYDIFSRGGVWVNNNQVKAKGLPVQDGDVLNLGGNPMLFHSVSDEERAEFSERRTSAGKTVLPSVTLFELTVLQLFLLMQLALADDEHILMITGDFLLLILLEWVCFALMKAMRRNGFEVETLAFYLTTFGLAVVCISEPADLYKQMILITVSVVLFILLGLWLRNIRRVSHAVRYVVAALALGLLGINVAAGTVSYGAANWLTIGGYSFQPSELVKVAYVFCGAATLENLYHRRNLILFIGFSAVCVGALAVIGDFGTALIFFICFLIISFMRSGSIATVFLAVGGAVLAVFMVLLVRPYVADRFSAWGHVWEDVYDKGYQQTRAMSAAASGGLFGNMPGNGWLHRIFAADTDMVFALICENYGLIAALCCIIAILTLAFFAIRSARRGRSTYYSIAACASVSIMMVQLALNVFGSVDLLPFTGVTFPFVSKGGTSLISCWMLMAFLKSADTRKQGSFAVIPEFKRSKEGS